MRFAGIASSSHEGTQPEADTEGRFDRWRCRSAALAAVFAGLTTLAAQLSSGAPSALAHRAAIGGIAELALHALGVAGALGMLVVAHGLWRGKRRAAYVAAGALTLISVGRAGLGLGPLNAGFDLLLAALLMLNIGAFRRGNASAGRGAAVSATIALVAAAGLYAAYALTILAAAHRTDTDQAIALAGQGLLAGAWWVGTNWWVRLVLDGLIATTIVAGAAFLHALLRPAQPSDGHSHEEHRKALEILRRHGADSLDPFALREDKAIHFAAGGFLSYRVLRETAVVSGDPIGPPGSAASILRSFITFARGHGWDVVVTGASDRQAGVARRAGLRSLRIGQEAIVDPAVFSLEGRAIRKVRQSVARAKRRGWGVEVVRGEDLSEPLWIEIERVHEAWRAGQPRLVGFAMTLGRLACPDEDQGALYVLGRDPEGRVRSFLRFAAFRDGLSLDLTCRFGDEPNGLTEAQVVEAISYAREHGMRGVSLNFAGFAHLMAADVALSHGQRLLRFGLRALHGRFQLERLAQFNAKFFPRWQTRYLLYGRLTHLPLAGLRVLQAEAYLPGPKGLRRPARWEARPGRAEPARRRRQWPAWVAAGATLLAAIALPSEMLVATLARAHPLHVSAVRERAHWSFSYPGARAEAASGVLYLPQGMPVRLRIDGAGAEPGATTQAADSSLAGYEGARSAVRVIRLRDLHAGRLAVPCAPGASRRCVIRADVVRPQVFWSRIDAGPVAGGVTAPAPAQAARDPDHGPRSE